MEMGFRIVKWFFGFLVLAILAIGIALYLIDPNDLKPQMVKAVKDATGRDLALDGDLSWSLYPSIGVNMGQASLSNPEGFTSPTFAKVDALSVGVKLLPLLSKKIQVNRVRLNGLALDLEVGKDGVSNWADLAAGAESSPQNGASNKPEDKKASSFDLKTIKLSGVNVDNATINYQDKQAGQAYVVSEVDINIGEIDWHSPIDVEGGLKFVDKATGLQATIKYDTEVAADAEKQQFDFNKLSLNVNATGKALPNQKVALSLNTQARVDVPNEQVNLSNMALKLDDSTLKGSASVAGFKKPSVKFDLALDGVDVDRYTASQSHGQNSTPAKDTKSAKTSDKIELPLDVLRALDLDGKLTIGRVKAGDVVVNKANIQAKAKAGQLSIAPIQWTMFDAPFSATAGLDVTGKTPSYALTANLKSLQLKPVLSQFAQYEDLDGTATGSVVVNTSGNSVSQLMSSVNGSLKDLAMSGVLSSKDFPNPIQLNLEAKAKLKGEQINLEKLVVKFDESQLNGSAQVVGFSNPAIRFNVDLDKVNLDKYLKGAEEVTESKSTSTSTTTGDEDLGLPVDLLRKLNLSGQLGVGALQVMNVKTSHIKAKLNAKDGLIQLNPLSMDLYQGTFNGTAVVDARGAKPTFKMNTALKQLQMNPMLVDVADLDYLSGLGGVQLNISTTGNTVNQLKQSLSGDWSLSLAEGVLKSDLLQGLGELLSLTEKTSATSNFNGSTPFKTLNGLGSITNGVLKTNNFKFDVEGINFNGIGKLNIANGQIDVGLDLKKGDVACTIPIKGSIGGLNYKQFVGQAVPGCLASAVQQRAEAEVQKKLDEEKDKLKSKVQNKLKDKLGDKLGKDILQDETGEETEDIGRALEKKAKKELLKGLFGD